MAAYLFPEPIGDGCGELGHLAGVDAARPAGVDCVLLGDASRPAREQHDPIAESYRLPDVVRHEQDGEAGARPERFELVVQEVAGHGVERAERLVHQEHVGLLREGPGERGALAHAAGELVRPLVAEVLEVHHLEQLVHAVLALRARDAVESQRELDVAGTVSQGNSADSWNMSEVRAPFTVTVPEVGWSSPATRLSRVLLPQPDAPIRQTNSPRARSSDTRSSAWVESPVWPNTLDTASREMAGTASPSIVASSVFACVCVTLLFSSI